MLRKYALPAVSCTLLAIAFSSRIDASGAASEGRFEQAYLAVPSSAGALETSRMLDRVPHYAGSSGDYQIAVYMRDRIRSFGVAAHVQPFPATVYTPKTLELKLLSSPVVTFDLRDQPMPGDSRALRPEIGLPFNAGSGDGDVKAPVVDAGMGLDADYKRLRDGGNDVRGKIALIRYGAEYRGNLARRAVQNGAAGVLFFTDPAKDKGKPYPAGPYPSSFTIQRGFVLENDFRQLPIPVLPIDARNARRLIDDMAGSAVTRSPAHLKVEMNVRRTTLWNTVARIPGADSTQSIVLGAHRDAWVYGVTDDGSGIATLVEVARGFGALRREGWIPKRTIVIAGWDAEEIGSLGATAYVTANRAALEEGCIAYINTDESASGPQFGVSAAGALAAQIVDPIHDVLGIPHAEVHPPSGGSDFDSFIYTLGTPIVDIGFTGPLGTYHSPYDDLRYAMLYADPGFAHHRSVAQAIGVLAMRLAADDRPIRFEAYSPALDSGMRAVSDAAARSKLVIDTEALQKAIRDVEAVAGRADARNSAQDVPLALRAAQRLDLISYSANGYASLAFPIISNAIATGKQSTVDDAVRQTLASLAKVRAELGQLSD